MIETIYELYKKAYSITTDSRNITKDCIFVALKGEHFDGNDFALKVAEEGIAAGVIADRKDLPKHERLFVVEDSLKCLQELAKHHRKQLGLPIIGITGTNGKTTTKELVSAVLAKKYNIAFTQGNFNNQLGVPLTLLRIKPGTELAVVEMGASHPGDIDELTGIGEPNYGIITNIGRAHLRDFGGYEGVIKTKNEMCYIPVNFPVVPTVVPTSRFPQNCRRWVSILTSTTKMTALDWSISPIRQRLKVTVSSNTRGISEMVTHQTSLIQTPIS